MTHDIQLVISAILCGGMLASATFIWRSNGPLMNAVAVMLFGISAEIVFAVCAERFSGSQATYDNIKIVGRLMEAVGVGRFLWCISRARIALPLTPPVEPVADKEPESC